MPRTVNVNYVTKEVKILLHDSETESLAAATANAAAESAQEAATNAANSASSASVTATQLMAYLETKEEITAPAVDPTLTISDAAADSQVTGNVAEDVRFRLDEAQKHIDYGYEKGSVHLLKTDGATDSKAFEFIRTGELVTISGGGENVPPVVLKVTNNIQRTIGTTYYLNNLANPFPVIIGHMYKVTLRCINDEAIATNAAGKFSISVYYNGTTSTTGVYRRTEDTFERMFLASQDSVHIVIYIQEGAVLSNAKFSIVFEDITNHDEEFLTYADSRINNEHNCINYNYPLCKEELFQNHPLPDDGGAFAVSRIGTIIKINGGGLAKWCVIRITGRMTRTTTTSTIRGWAEGISLTENHKYLVKMKALSTSAITNFNNLSVSVYKIGTSSTIGTAERDLNDYTFKREFTADSNLLNMVIFVAANTEELVDAVVEVTLQDITFSEDEDGDTIQPYYLEEMTDTVSKVQAIKDEPCLTFMWATDIHRHSSNALGVQTFSEMIKNMKEFSKFVHCDFILNTGDDTDGDVVAVTTLQRAYDMTKKFMSIGVPYIKSHGNHDNNPYYQSGAAVFDIKQCCKAYYTLMPHNVTLNVAENGTDFYIDYNDIGVRFISLNDNNVKTRITYSWGSTTPNWLISALETDKTVLLSLHISPIPSQVYNNQSVFTSALNRDVLNALNNFVNRGGNLIMLSGHSHADMAFISPFLSVMSVCQRYYVDETSVDDSPGFQVVSGYIDVIKRPVREAGTYTEDAWTAGVYKPFSNELHLIRFGAGTDRHFHVTPIAPTTVTSMLTGTITWSSSDESVATVSDGVITGVSTGKCAVLAKDASGNYECWIVSVE